MSPALRIKLFFALAALCLASAVRAQDGAYAVSGRVIDRLTRQPVAYAAVVPVGQEQRGASTDSLGRFRLERVRAGIFRLSASRSLFLFTIIIIPCNVIRLLYKYEQTVNY